MIWFDDESPVYRVDGRGNGCIVPGGFTPERLRERAVTLESIADNQPNVPDRATVRQAAAIFRALAARIDNAKEQ